MEQLQTKIANLEIQNQFKADQDAVQTAQMEMLTTLRTIRAAITSASTSSSNGASSKELQALKEENESLKKKTMKQEFRIRHLISGMEEMQEKLESS
jgi:hypothetical protein